MGLNSQSIAWDAQFCEKFVQKGYFVVRYDTVIRPPNWINLVPSHSFVCSCPRTVD